MRVIAVRYYCKRCIVYGSSRLNRPKCWNCGKRNRVVINPVVGIDEGRE